MEEPTRTEIPNERVCKDLFGKKLWIFVRPSYPDFKEKGKKKKEAAAKARSRVGASEFGLAAIIYKYIWLDDSSLACWEKLQKQE